MEHKMQERKDEAIKKKLTIQPYTLVLGPLKKVDKIYTVIDEHCWEQKAVTDAFFSNFKIFFIFNLCYPVASSKMWTFLQIFLFQIKTKNDSKSGLSAIYTLANDLKLTINDGQE